MQLTDQEIREILIREKRRKKQRKRVIRRVSLLVLIVAILVVGIGIFLNRNVFAQPRGIIFIDAGHGGVDGGSAVDDRLEKDDALKLSLAVQKELEDRGFRVYMSRTDDADVDREERGMLANAKEAQLFISIHRNKAEEGNGIEVFIPSNNDKSSQLLGKKIMKALVSEGFAERTVRPGTLVSSEEDYYENSVPKMPSCLVEVGFMQDKTDNKLFDENFDNNAKAIAKAIESTFAKLFEPEETEEEI